MQNQPSNARSTRTGYQAKDAMHLPSSSITFRTDIQGLRAIAVLAVIFNHLGVQAFSGGYAGVDIFFVISGFIITRQIIGEYEQHGRFHFLRFYLRRFLRLFPAAITICLLTLVAAFLLFSQERLESVAKSAIASLYAVANIHFWRDVGYFDSEAISKPLLHMWSLGVEEQFYLLWPCLLLAAWKWVPRQWLVPFFLLVAAGSLTLNAIWFDTILPQAFLDYRDWRKSLSNPEETAFYLMPFRIFEFCLGAMAALLADARRSISIPPFVRSVLLLMGWAVIFYAVLSLDASDRFPYWNAFFVTLATALVIHLTPASRLSGRILSFPILVHIGTISYSLYLVHWPIIVFYRIVTPTWGHLDMAICMGLMLACSIALYFGVERPARAPRTRQPPKFTWHRHLPTTMTTAFLILTWALSLALPSVDNRIPEYRQTLKNTEWRKMERKTYCRKPIGGLPGNLVTCQHYNQSENTIVIWGDSHAQHLVAGFVNSFPNHNIGIAYLSSCPHQSGFLNYVYPMDTATERCIQRNRGMLDWLRISSSKYVVLLSSAKRGKPETMAGINNWLVQQLREAGHEAWILGDYIRPERSIGACRSVPDYLLSDRHLDKICGPDIQAVLNELSYAKTLQALTGHYIPLHEVQCPSADHCRFLDDQKRPTFRDTHHLSITGSTYEVDQATPMLVSHIPSLQQ